MMNFYTNILNVVIDNLDENTRVHYRGGGGGQGLFTFDWGASGSFEDIVYDILESHLI